MFVLKSLYDYLFAPPPSKEWYIKEYHRIIKEFEEFGKDDDEADNHRHVEESYMPDAVFFQHKGTITKLYSDGKGYIDNKYLFNSEAALNLRLREGDRVICTARKISDDRPLVIYKINLNEEDNWTADNQDLNQNEPGVSIPLGHYEQIMRGKVTAKFNGEIAVELFEYAKPLKMPISEINCAFNPTEGDQVVLDVVCGENPQNPSEVILIGYYDMKANDEQFITGKITTFKKNQQYGLIDEKYIFFMDVLRHSSNQNFIPNKGDTVSADVISSHQKRDDREYFWRCKNLVKIHAAKSKMSSTMDMNSDALESDDEIDNDCGLTFTPNSALQVTLDAKQSKKRIEFVVENTSNQIHRVHQPTFSNEIIASLIECRELYRYQDIRVGGRFVYGIEVSGKFVGTFKLKLDFKVDNKHLVRRCITIDVQSIDECNTVRTVRSAAYTRSVYTDKRDVIKGIRPVDSPHFIDNRLYPFTVPPNLFETALTSNDAQMEAKHADLFSKLHVRNYSEFFHVLLYMEETYMRHEFRMYDQDRGHFQREGEYMVYQMNKNVFECRPSIIIGDTITAHSLESDSSSSYQGFIHKMRNKHLLLKFADEFHSSYRGQDFKLVFNFSRSKLIKQHNAIERISKKMLSNKFEYLFPNAIKSSKHLQLEVQMVDGDMVLDYPSQKIPWFNPNLNEIQKKAVFNVLRGEVKMCPYIVFGPPGTGKTSTLIEIILQLYRKGNSRLIVAAPSNSAANLITKHLAECGKLKAGEFKRIVGQNSLERDLIPDELRTHCITTDIAAARSRSGPQNLFDNGIRIQCNSDEIKSHRILISTCMTFGSLLYMKFPSSHFTHAIIDEAGQCTEPEIAIPISLIDKDDGQIILAGDPQQLGPVVLSQNAKKYGLSKSLLTRLLDHLPYQPDVGRNGGFDERMVTQLLHNYRSLPSILSEYSIMSYDSKLIPNISDEDSDEQRLLAKIQATIHKTAKLKHVDKQGVYFIGVRGKDETTKDSTSWRNPHEVLEVVTLAFQLYNCGLTENDIGIITPYTLQAKEIRSLCDEYLDGNLPKIGSVEEFQGQERNVIVLSTVRSSTNRISQDGKYGIGFINNKNRLNVAISRARAMLVIVGNPDILGLDENWRQIIYNCYVKRSYSGCKIPKALLEQMQH